MDGEYYRVLNPHTKALWDDGEHRSSNDSYPVQWPNKWKETDGSMNPADYPLDCGGFGRLHPDALAAFLAFAKAGGTTRVSQLSLGQKYLLGQLDGVCAWETRHEAWRWACLGDLRKTWIAVFRGEDATSLPEAGGVLVRRVNEVMDVLPAEDFAKKYDCPFEPEDEEGPNVDLPPTDPYDAR